MTIKKMSLQGARPASLERNLFRRILAVPVILVVEYLVIFLTFAHFHDGDVLDPLPALVRASFSLAQVLAAVLTASVCSAYLFWGTTIRGRLVEISDKVGPLSPGMFALHIVSFLSLFSASALVLSSDGQGAGFAALFLTTIVLALTCIVTLALSATRNATGEIISRLAGPLAGSLIVGGVVSGLAVSAYQLSTFLTPITLTITASLLGLISDNVVVEREISALLLGDFGVRVGPSCSGAEGLGLVSLFLLGYLYKYREDYRLPHALILLPIGVAASFFANSVRIAGLMLIGRHIDPELAVGGFHSKAGWIFFCTITVSIIWFAERTPWLMANAAPTFPSHSLKRSVGMTPEALYLLPFVVWLGTGLLTSAFSNDPASLYPLRVLVMIALAAAMAPQLSRQFASLRASPRSRVDLAHLLPPLAIGAVVFAIWLGLSPRLSASIEPSAAHVPEGMIILGIVRLIGHVVFVPVIEEAAFRGYLQRRLIAVDFDTVSQRSFSLLSFVVSSLCFGLLHDNWLAGILAGMAFSLATYIRGRLTDAVLAHAFTNFLIGLAAIFFGRWDLM